LTFKPPPPDWLSAGLATLNESYPNDSFEAIMRYCAINTDTDQPVAIPQDPARAPSNIGYFYLPRIRCHDCPGKLYTSGTDMTTGNFEVHLKNRNHRERVDARVAKAAAGDTADGAGAGAGAGEAGVVNGANASGVSGES
jgi:SWI/SNF-related matrix-associated actin-dependent regulator of chromatin subfamily B member 1